MRTRRRRRPHKANRESPISGHCRLRVVSCLFLLVSFHFFWLMKMSVVIRSYRISTRGPGWTARSPVRLGPRCVLSSIIELRERGEQLPTARSPSNSKVLAELSRPNLAIPSRARPCSRNCARFGATIGHTVRTSCSSLTRRPDPPIARVSSSQNSPDSSLPVAAQRALDRAGRERVPAEH